MKITDATWEKRNLGVDVTEISCDAHDDAGELINVLDSINTAYNVIKLPTMRPDLLNRAQEYGYHVVEMTISMEGDMRKLRMPKICSKFIPYIRTQEAGEMDRDLILGEIRRGEIFKTDRIARDPHFSLQIAGRRYYNWCCDALDQGAIMEVVYYKDQPAAYAVSKCKDSKRGIYDNILGGVLTEFADKGMGFLVIYGALETTKRYGGMKSIGRVSSNNLPILRVEMEYGFEIRDMSYVLVKHQ